MFGCARDVMFRHWWPLKKHENYYGKTCNTSLEVPRNAGRMYVIKTQEKLPKAHLEPQRNAKMTADEIEFETTLPRTDNKPIGPYYSGYQVPCSDS